MLRLACTLCHECIVGRGAIEAHVAEHKSVGDAVQVWWAVSDGLVLQPIIARAAKAFTNDIKEADDDRRNLRKEEYRAERRR